MFCFHFCAICRKMYSNFAQILCMMKMFLLPKHLVEKYKNSQKKRKITEFNIINKLSQKQFPGFVILFKKLT